MSLGYRDKNHVELKIFLFLRILLVDGVLEGFEVLVGAAVLHAFDDVVLSFGVGDERADAAALQHAIEISGPGRTLHDRR